MKKKLIWVNGYKAHYIDQGKGEIIFLVPSMLVMLRLYYPLITYLSQYFRVIAVESPGSGFSSPLKSPWSFEEYAFWLHEFINTLNTGPYNLIGHSNSGAVAIIMASLYPNQVKKLILADTVGADNQHYILRTVIARLIDGFIELKLSLTAGHLLFFNLFFHTSNFSNQIILSAKKDVVEYARMVKAPTLLAWGKYDLTIPLSCAEKLNTLIPNSSIYISKAGSHDWIVNNFREFSRTSYDFIFP